MNIRDGYDLNQFALLAVPEMLGKVSKLQGERLLHLAEMRAEAERSLADAKEKARTLPETIAKYSADIAALEAMSARDVLLALLPEEPKPQPTVAEHVQAPGMFAILHVESGKWWNSDPNCDPTDVASEVLHHDAVEAGRQAGYHGLNIRVYRLDDLHTVDGILKIKPGSKPVTFPAVQS